MTAFTTARQLSLSWVRTIQSIALIPPLKDQFLYFPIIYTYVVSFRLVFPPGMDLPSPANVLHTRPTLTFLVWSPE